MKVELPTGYNLEQFKKEIMNMYYNRDTIALQNFIDRLDPFFEHPVVWFGDPP